MTGQPVRTATTRALKSLLLAVVVAFALVGGAGLAAAGDATEPAGEPSDIEAGDDVQAVADLTVTDTDSGEDGVDVYVNVTALESADIGLDSLNVEVGDDDVEGATLVDQNVAQDSDNTTVRMTFDVDEDETEFTVEEFALVQLDTTDASASEDLRYHVAVDDDERVGDQAPNESDASSDTFSVLVDEDDTDETDDAVNETETPTPTEATDDTATNDTDDSDGTVADTDDDTGADGDADAEEDGTGFGLAVAALGLLGAALLARR